MKNVMIDLETLDIICSARIISIGAVEFDLESKQLGREFFMLVDHTSQIRRTTSEDTLKWWDGQSEAAKKQLTGYILLSEALMEFRDWLPEDCIVWGNGSSFDIGILEHAYTEFSMLYPWKYNAIRDVRTINHLYTSTFGKFDFKKQKGHHVALADAIYQAEYVQEMWSRLTS